MLRIGCLLVSEAFGTFWAMAGSLHSPLGG